jgi:hypothetical protein
MTRQFGMVMPTLTHAILRCAQDDSRGALRMTAGGGAQDDNGNKG